jgi:hypothetical protein
MIRAVALLLCFPLVPLRANLGETVGQCVVRYGKPVGRSEATATFPFGTVAFSAGNYTLVVFLLNNKEAGARVSKTDKSAFSDAEIKNIMDADSNGSPWTPTTSDDPTSLKWTRSDKATVLYDKVNRMLIFTAEEMTSALSGPVAKPVAPAP